MYVYILLNTLTTCMLLFIPFCFYLFTIEGVCGNNENMSYLLEQDYLLKYILLNSIMEGGREQHFKVIYLNFLISLKKSS